MTTLSLAGRRADRSDTDPPLDWRVLAVWSALFLNVLQFAGLPTVLPIPGPVGQLIAQEPWRSPSCSRSWPTHGA